MKAKNIVVKFGRAVVVLSTQESRITTREGVELWIKQCPASEIKPMATIPVGTLEIYKHTRPVILRCDWE